jgi:dephospho-CoA kinase
MSGTGKSAVIQALARRGYKAVDTDDGWVFDDLRDVEPLLREVADYEISTTTPINDVVTAVLRIAAQ